ncbi:HAD-like domain-containing protein [Choanephora cucurbitarum]|nr:HAD-like domain-containing protein [Choanephora cucurbitarum]
MTPQGWWKELVYSTFMNAGVKAKDLDSSFDPLYDALYARFTTAEAYSIFPDVLDTLDQLKKLGYQMGVISNSDERVVKVIESLDLNKYFDFVLASALVGHEKPSKIIYQEALKQAGHLKPEQALHVGDDIEKDYFGATKAGWHAVLLERTKLSYEDFSPAMFSDNDSPGQLPLQIMTLNDLHSYIETIHNTNRFKQSSEASNPV